MKHINTTSRSSTISIRLTESEKERLRKTREREQALVEKTEALLAYMCGFEGDIQAPIVSLMKIMKLSLDLEQKKCILVIASRRAIAR